MSVAKSEIIAGRPLGEDSFATYQVPAGFEGRMGTTKAGRQRRGQEMLGRDEEIF